MEQQAKQHGPAMILLAMLIILFISPIYRPWELATHIHGNDAYSAAWGTNWAQHVLWKRPWDYYQMPIFYPQHFPRFFTDLNPLAAFVTAPLRLIGSPLFAYNGMMVAILVAVGWGYYLTAWCLTRNRRASLIAALMYACNGDQIYHAVGHPNIMCPLFFPPAIYFTYLLDQRRKPWHAAALAICIALQFSCSIYHGVILLIFCGIVWATMIAVRRGKFHRGHVFAAGAFAFALAIAFVYTLPFQNISARFGQSRGLNEAAQYSADLVGYAIPSTVDWTSRGILGTVLSSAIINPKRLENTQFFGYFAWVCAIVALLKWRERRTEPITKFYLLLIPAAVIGMILSFGPWLWVGSRLTLIPLPYKLFWESFPQIHFMRVPSRFSIIPGTVVAIGLLVTLAQSKRFNSKNKYALFAGAVALVFLEFFPVQPWRARLFDEAPMSALTNHSEYKIVMPIPLNEPEFMVAAAVTFPLTPGGTTDGIYNTHFREMMAAFQDFPGGDSLPLMDALKVDAVLIYGQERMAIAERLPQLKAVEKWAGGGLYEYSRGNLASAEKGQRILSQMRERPAFSESPDFPASTPENTRWIPGAWRVMDHEKDPPVWNEMPFAKMASPGFVSTGLKQLFFDGIQPAVVKSVHVKMATRDVGVDFAIARIYWLNDGDAGWSPEKSMDVPIATDGKMRVVTFDLSTNRHWSRDKPITGFQFEFTTTPHPGQRVAVDEIRLERLAESVTVD